ncbi:hypothetical protein BaRGS_00007578 [Batillaria attramentaria]|uniref:Secreted protein n=1 Tax=Batillaria attramentaria TaxID=370345 RepID=A0ABD0LQ05_9CAEN
MTTIAVLLPKLVLPLFAQHSFLICSKTVPLIENTVYETEPPRGISSCKYGRLRQSARRRPREEIDRRYWARLYNPRFLSYPQQSLASLHADPSCSRDKGGTKLLFTAQGALDVFTTAN